MKSYLVKIIVEPDGDSFYARCPGLPEVQTCGATQEEAFQNALAAASAVVGAKEKYGDKIKMGLDLLEVHAQTKEEAAPFLRREEQVVLCGSSK